MSIKKVMSIHNCLLVKWIPAVLILLNGFWCPLSAQTVPAEQEVAEESLPNTNQLVKQFDADGKQLASLDAAGTGEQYDFEFWFGKTVADVRRVRFVSLADQGNENPCSDTAIAEIEIE